MVTSANDSSLNYSVDLDRQVCSCNYWELNKFPCIHAARLCTKISLSLSSILHSHDRTDLWKQQYETCHSNFYVPTGIFISGSLDEDIRPPLAVPLPRGRPKKNRFKSASEGTKRVCGKCSGTGHNARTCRSVVVNSQTQN